MADTVWIGTTSSNANTAANWSGAAVPANADTLTYDARGNSADCDWSTFTFTGLAFPSVKIFPSFAKKIGASGAALAPANGITNLVYASGGQSTCWINCAVTHTSVDSPNPVENALNLDGTYTNLKINRGSVLMDATAVFAAAARITLSGPSARLTVPAGVTYGDTANVLTVEDGQLLINAAANGIIRQTGGVCILGSDGGTQTLTTLEQDGGTFVWASSGTMTTAHWRGGKFWPNTITDFTNPATTGDVAKILTNAFIYDGADVDLRNALNLTTATGLPNGIINNCSGTMGLKTAMGTKITVALP